MDQSVLARKQLTELKGIASTLQMRGYQRLKKAELIEAIIHADGGAPSAGRATRRTTEVNGEANGAAEHDGDTRSSVAVAERPAEPEAPASRQLALDGAGDGTPETPGGPRTRTRTRSRERTAQGDGTAETGTAPADDAQSAAAAGTSEDDRPRSRRRERNRGDADTGRDGADAGGDAATGRATAGTDGADTTESRAPDDGAAEVRQTAAPAGAAAREQDDDDESAGTVARGQAEAPEGRDRPQGDRPAGDRQQGRGQSGQQGQSGQGQQGQQAGGPDGDDDSGGRRSRRSRRERRRNKGDKPQQGRGQQGQQQGQPFRDEDPGAEPGEVRSGVLDILPEGYGFIRTSGYLPGDRDVYISQSLVRRHALRRGDVVEGPIRQQRTNEKVPALHHVETVNGVKPAEDGALPHRPDFKDMTPLFPNDRLRLETPEGPTSMRIIDLMSPIGKGQRGLIVSPPKAGKTTILKELGQAIAFNNPECHLMVVLVDERPEEVTDMQRSVPGEIIASTFDRPADDHTQIAELAIERAKRLVENGRDVVILLDSITRLSRAYNLAAPASGRIMSGGVDSTALYPPKRFFGAARNIEDGGSLTIIASALIETGSKMDEVIFEEFKGTGNCEIRLDRKLEQKRIYPAIDIEASGTRKEELLLDREELAVIWKLRRVLHALDGPGAIELLIDKMKQTRSNNQFLVAIQKTNLQS